MVTVTAVAPHSRAEKAGMRAGDRLHSINFREIRDVLDYRFFLAERTVRLCFFRGEERHEVVIT